MNSSESADTREQAGADAMADLAPSCKAAARLMSEARDRTLSQAEEQSLNAHLADCKNCVRFNTQLDFLAKLAKRYAEGKLGTKS